MKKSWALGIIAISLVLIYLYATNDERQRKNIHENYQRGQEYIQTYGEVDGCERAELGLERQSTNELNDKALEYVDIYIEDDDPDSKTDTAWRVGVKDGYVNSYDSAYRECEK
ncbi:MULTISPECIES: hypothetical protein [Bacillus cereus group]|uniref:hypothetical protein n=1 Tax=Bacillus cereus group TaxID=86661 RepID=UPI000452B517|nr:MULTISPECIES: hypothetical protein [Bacillus cereus group]EXY09187.1 hypothetical protein BF15_01260 [Bacillus thuringiensis]MEB8633045.1 hypothetical protein [Bacillus cereus]MEB8741816.1 hypothetical protein [Bacillus cereus]MEB8796433.1 hypothetical protein [Bacillus cereus]MEB8807063.1 hypothetical protein [Bacillus cereus]